MSNPLSATFRALAVPELVLEVVSHLDQDDLVQTALTSQAWSAATAVILYREPRLNGKSFWDTEANHERLAQLLETIQSRPDLGARVKGARLGLGCSDEQPVGAPTEVQLATQLVLACENFCSLTLSGEPTASNAARAWP